MDKIQTPEKFAEHWNAGGEMVAEIRARDAAVREPLVEAGVALVKEWDILPAEMPLRIEDITEWLQRYLGPQVEALRAALKVAKEKTPDA